MQNKRILPIFLFIVIILILAATPLYFVLNKKQDPIVTPTPEPTPIPTALPEVTTTTSPTPSTTTTMKTYTSSNGRLQFSYPADYLISKKPAEDNPRLNEVVMIYGGKAGQEFSLKLEIQGIGPKGPAYTYDVRDNYGYKDQPTIYKFGTKNGFLYKDMPVGQSGTLSLWAWNCVKEEFALVAEIEQKAFDKAAKDVEPILSSASVDGVTSCE